MQSNPLILAPIYFIVVIVGVFVFKIIFHKISVLSSQLCIYHSRENPTERFLKLFRVFFYLSIPFILIIYAIFASFGEQLLSNRELIRQLALVAGAVSFIVLVSFRFMALNKWSCKEIDIKNEKARIESNIYSIITAYFVFSIAIMAYTILIKGTQILPSLSLTYADIIILLGAFLANIFIMTLFSTALTAIFRVEDRIKICN